MKKIHKTKLLLVDTCCRDHFFDASKLNDVLVSFLTEKSEMIKNCIDIVYITNIDIRDIQDNWTDEDCNNFIDNMGLTDRSICPWCMCRKGRCVSCSYGARYHVCDRDGSKYNDIKIKLNGSIVTQVSGMSNLVNKYKAFYNGNTFMKGIVWGKKP